jgi:hypothetical protein
MDLPLYPEFPGTEVEVTPLEGAYLTTVQTCGELQQEKFKAVVLLSLDQQSLYFFRSQHLHLPGLGGGETTAISWIAE